MFRRVLVHRTELLRPGAAFIAAESDTNHIAVLEANGFFDDTLRFLNPEVTSGVEDPIQRHAKVTLTALSAAFQPFEQRGEFLPPPLHDADRNVDFGMKNILRM